MSEDEGAPERWWEGMTLDERRAYAMKRATPDPELQAEIEGEKLRAKRIEERECGDCRLCCKILQIEESAEINGIEFSKPGNTWCEHSTSDGCQIHSDESRLPVACASFLCAWRAGFLEDDERPDRLKSVPKLENGPPIGHAVTWYVQPGYGELGKAAQKAATRMLDGTDRVVQWPLPQCIVVATGRLSVMVLPGMRMEGARGIPGAGMIRRWQEQFAIYLAGGAGVRAHREGLKPTSTNKLIMGPGPLSPGQKRRVAKLVKQAQEAAARERSTGNVDDENG
jgi:hypothetical protein